MASALSGLDVLRESIVSCRKCPRLIEHCAAIAQTKRKAFRDWTYWGQPVPPFGDPDASLFLLGLAPAAHGANRTGRVFTGDRSGDFLYRALYETGFANQPHSRSNDDGLTLKGAWISASVRCAPPDNKPTPEEIVACRSYLERELHLLPNIKVVLALGKIAFDNYLAVMKDRGVIRSRAGYVFGHGVQYSMGPALPLLMASYHPSQQNTSTGKLSAEMLRAVIEAAAANLRPD